MPARENSVKNPFVKTSRTTVTLTSEQCREIVALLGSLRVEVFARAALMAGALAVLTREPERMDAAARANCIALPAEIHIHHEKVSRRIQEILCYDSERTPLRKRRPATWQPKGA